MEINISPFDQKDLIELLDYASAMKEEQRPQKRKGRGSTWDDTDYWVMRIEQLKMLLKGRNVSNSLYGSSLPEGEPNEFDKRKEYYRKVEKKQNDILDIKKWY